METVRPHKVAHWIFPRFIDHLAIYTQLSDILDPNELFLPKSCLFRGSVAVSRVEVECLTQPDFGLNPASIDSWSQTLDKHSASHRRWLEFQTIWYILPRGIKENTHNLA